MNPVDPRIHHLSDLGLDRLDGRFAPDTPHEPAEVASADPLLAEIGQPAAAQPAVDDGETVLAVAVWKDEDAVGSQRLVGRDLALQLRLASLDRAEAIDVGVDAVVDALF